MKTFGDLPIKDEILLKELIRLEEWFYEHCDTIPLLAIGKGLTCIAHDYYSIFFEEEGQRLLKLVNIYCPGYFKAPILSQMAKEKEFNKLVKALANSEALEVMKSMGFVNEPLRT